jgi:16S rRNA (guanine527-N7)-methyltransferase
MTDFGSEGVPPSPSSLLENLLLEARRYGFLGPGPVTDQIARSLAFTKAVTAAPRLAIDLGSGGGIPGLVLALAWPDTRWIFVDSNQRRTTWLGAAVAKLGAGHRLQVLCDRAENVGRSSWRGSADLVTARSFAPPAPTAECAAPLLKQGSRLLVADPPDHSPSRWPAQGLAEVGLVLENTHVIETGSGPASISSLVAVSVCPSRYPRRVGIPLKRPLF